MSPRPPILFIHGLFGHPGLMRPWIDRFESYGYECHTVTLPGRDPTDTAVLRRATLRDYFEIVVAARNELVSPPVVIGHSIGGLLGQKLAASTECTGLVLLASTPPGILWTQPRALPHLLRILPAILAGRPVLPSAQTMRAVPLSTLEAGEQEDIIPHLVPDSGRVFRSMSIGSSPTRVKRGSITCPVLCVSGDQDRNVSARTSRAIAVRYGAEHQTHAGAPHWIIAESLLDDVAPGVLNWMHRTVGPPRHGVNPTSEPRRRSSGTIRRSAAD